MKPTFWLTAKETERELASRSIPARHCLQCGRELPEDILLPFCNAQCEYEYNKVGF
jgi:hypothetical protein